MLLAALGLRSRTLVAVGLRCKLMAARGLQLGSMLLGAALVAAMGLWGLLKWMPLGSAVRLLCRLGSIGLLALLLHGLL